MFNVSNNKSQLLFKKKRETVYVNIKAAYLAQLSQFLVHSSHQILFYCKNCDFYGERITQIHAGILLSLSLVKKRTKCMHGK